MGKGIVDELKKEFRIRDEWHGLEIHPETPPGGVLMHDIFPGRNISAMYENLQRQGARFGLNFAERARLSNSRLALEASEFARATEAFNSFHSEIFYAYFAKGQDIGDLNIILQAAEKCVLDASLLADALRKGIYAKTLAANQGKARELGIRSVPTFIINGHERIVGAHSVEKFREFMNIMASEHKDGDY